MTPFVLVILGILFSLGDCNTFFEEIISYTKFGGWINTVNKPSVSQYDFIVVGSGPGGATVASRLADNRKWKVLLLEAGSREGVINQIPIAVSSLQLTDYNWGYTVQPQKKCCLGMNNRQCAWPRGKALGGTSTLYYMIHTRGHKLDYDEWEALGNSGWGYESILPYFKKSERFRGPEANDTEYHNINGNLCVEYTPYQTPLVAAFLSAGKELGYKIVDYNAKEQIGFSRIQFHMDKGTRCSSSKAYLKGDRPNLEIVTGARVSRVLIDSNNRAYGVEFIKENKWQKVYASKEVVLSAGTIDSAKLLMLSGIGPREHLQSLGIKVIKDLKVGYNMYEHVGFLGLTFLVNVTGVSLGNSLLLKPSTAIEYLTQRKGPLTIPGGPEGIAFVRTKYATDSRPDVELLFVAGSLHSDNGLFIRKGLRITDEVYNAVYKPITGMDAWSIWPIGQKPRSFGRLTLQSKSPFEPPIIEPNFFNHPADIEIILEGIKHAIKVMETSAFQAFGSRLHTAKIPGCASFEFGSDDYWRCAIMHLPSMMNHEIGTVKMGPKTDPTAVVDPELSVHGVKGLRVVDASVMPTMPVGHVSAGIYMLAEKGADMIKQAWQ